MYKLSLLFVSLLCITLARADQPSVTVKVNPASNPWWLAVTILNGNSETKTVDIRDSVSDEWKQMSFESDWGYWTRLSSSPEETLKFPLSLRLTSTEGSQITLPSVITSLGEHEISTRNQYEATEVQRHNGGHHTHHNTEAPTTAPTERPTQAPTHEPTAAPTHAPTHAPTSAPTHAPTAAPTHAATAAPTHAATAAPTHAPTAAPTHAPTAAPTHAPTAAPTHAATSAPTHAATTAPSGGCSGGMKMLVPLYTDPGSEWNTIISGASSVPTVAIINPDSGPGGAPDSSYSQYMTTMANAGVEMVGYVHTSYGARSLSDVEADIETYASEWPGLVGIFLDEVATSSSELSYYQSLYNYIMSMPGWKYDIINPGTLPDSG
jgi:hypothetical protein